MKDSLKPIRIEWLFGFTSLNTTATYNRKINRFGLAYATKMGSDIHTYFSPVTIHKNYHKDPILAILTKYLGRMDYYVINCLDKVLELALEDEDISRHIYNAPTPSYQLSKYTDWFEEYLASELAKA